MATLTKEEKRLIRIQINDLLDRHCQDCEVLKQNRKKYGINKGFQICSDCKIGKQIEELGRKLWGEKEEKSKMINGNEKFVGELTKERYLRLKENGKSDNAIVKMFEGMYWEKLKKLKEEWGLNDDLKDKLEQLEDLQKQLDEKEKEVNSYLLVIDSLKKDLNKKSEMINLLKSLLREVL